VESGLEHERSKGVHCTGCKFARLSFLFLLGSNVTRDSVTVLHCLQKLNILQCTNIFVNGRNTIVQLALRTVCSVLTGYSHLQ